METFVWSCLEWVRKEAVARPVAAVAATVLTGWTAITAARRRRWVDGEALGGRRAVIVTGCDSGFGYATAHRLAEAGFTIFAGVLDIHGPGAVALRARNSLDLIRLHRSNFRRAKDCGRGVIHTVDLDITDDASVAGVCQIVDEWLSAEPGRTLHALVNNAGVQNGSLVELTSLTQFEEMLNVNVLGMVRMTKAFIPRLSLAPKYKGRIINITSVMGLVQLPGAAGYSASKHAAEAVTSTLRWELAAWRGLKVITINPGMFATRMVETSEAKAIASFERSSEEAKWYYGEAFCRAGAKAIGIFSKLAGDPEEVVDTVEESVCSAAPAVRYFVGVDAFLFWRPFYLFCPEVIKDWAFPMFMRFVLDAACGGSHTRPPPPHAAMQVPIESNLGSHPLAMSSSISAELSCSPNTRTSGISPQRDNADSALNSMGSLLSSDIPSNQSVPSLSSPSKEPLVSMKLPLPRNRTSRDIVAYTVAAELRRWYETRGTWDSVDLTSIKISARKLVTEFLSQHTLEDQPSVESACLVEGTLTTSNFETVYREQIRAMVEKHLTAKSGSFMS